MTQTASFSLVETNEQLAEVCQLLSQQDWIAIDTEFMREKTYYPELSLVQIGIPDGCWCIDPLAVSDLNPLIDLLTNRKVLKLFHAASQDIELLYYLCKEAPGPVFDTQIAASMLGYGDQMGYANLVQEVLGITLEKTQSRTDWSRRPLTEAQLSYAADDVIYLWQLYEKIRQSLESKGRLEWLTPDFEQLESLDNFQLGRDALLKKVKGQQRLKPRQLAIAREIAIWREKRSQHINKPRKWVMSDDILCDISKQTPDTLEKLGHIRGIHDNLVKHHGKDILNAIQTGLSLPAEELPRPPKRKKLSREHSVIIDTLNGLLSYAANKADISPTQLANRKDLEKYLQGDSKIPLMQGWRYQLAGKLIEEFLSGNLRLGIEDNEIKLF